MKKFEEIIKDKRIELTLTQKKMALLIGISKASLSKYEGGKHKPKAAFFLNWNVMFGEDLERNKSHNNF